ncbi:hypothetical protein SDC9_160769 [bioreactor metagenome]|uniref:Uncharacterized protein n=1 Tax=bioreactor metagenome TaxID=1076179 RepID=A0A645FGD5_9ZZZZ
MDGVGKQLLAYAAFPGDKHREVVARVKPGPLLNGNARLRLGENMIEGILGFVHIGHAAGFIDLQGIKHVRLGGNLVEIAQIVREDDAQPPDDGPLVKQRNAVDNALPLVVKAVPLVQLGLARLHHDGQAHRGVNVGQMFAQHLLAGQAQIVQKALIHKDDPAVRPDKVDGDGNLIEEQRRDGNEHIQHLLDFVPGRRLCGDITIWCHVLALLLFKQS